MPAASRPLEDFQEPREEDFDTGVYPTGDLDLAEVVRRARAAIAGSPGIPDAVVWSRFEQRRLRRA